MKSLLWFSLFSTCSYRAVAHGGHEHDGPAEGETMKAYAERHMASEHHIAAFDIPSFFQLHDLNRDGVWDKEEIEAIYGVHHIYSQKKSKDDIEHMQKADTIVKVVLDRMDKDRDNKITVQEFQAVGLEGLPNFDNLGAEGHHYDIESEFFLHHEEQFHSTPETQTDESYTHPEDLEHFAHHEHIELKEAEKEAVYQGISVEEVLASHEAEDEHVEAQQDGTQQEPVPVAHPHDDMRVDPNAPKEAPNPKIQRVTPPEKQDPSVKYSTAKSDAQKKSEWGSGDDGYLPPSDPSDKMRKNMPYKYKFKRNWNDF